MTARIVEQHADQPERRDDDPLRLHIAAERRQQEEPDKGGREAFQRTPHRVLGPAARHALM